MRRKKRSKRTPTHTTPESPDSEAIQKREASTIEEKRPTLAKKIADMAGMNFYEYTLTDEPMLDKEYRKLPRKVQDRAEDLYLLAQQQPSEALEEIRRLIARYPKVPQFYNFLSVAYSALGDLENRNTAILECYSKFPTYLFARLNYAQLFLENKYTEGVAELFEHHFDLKTMYPHRSTFHVSEFTNFAGIIIWYYHLTGERFAARQYYKKLKEIAPDNIWTKRSKILLYPSFKARVLNWVLAQLRKIQKADAERTARIRKLRRRRRRRRP